MNKRAFLKATGLTFFMSLLVFGRRAEDGAASVANAQEGDDLAKRVAELAERYAEIEKRCGRYETQLRLLQANDGTLEERLKGLSFSFIGTIAAISTMEIPDGWRLCDGTPIPNTDEFHVLREIIGEPYCFPDYRGVFLRGLDEVATDGSPSREFDPGRTLDGEVQGSANLAHSHGTKVVDEKTKKEEWWTEIGGAHTHAIDNTDVGRVYPSERKEDKGNAYYEFNGCSKKRETVNRVQLSLGKKVEMAEREWRGFGPPKEAWLVDNRYPHMHKCLNEKTEDREGHKHRIDVSGGSESRPVNVAVRYIIRYA